MIVAGLFLLFVIQRVSLIISPPGFYFLIIGKCKEGSEEAGFLFHRVQVGLVTDSFFLANGSVNRR
tara:strand:+ start:560 stop:757 length:198 start_codon:yes stop_codon:yes gene_type:complete